MTWSVDARIPVRFGAVAAAEPGMALLVEGAGPLADGVPDGEIVARFQLDPAADHAAGCACCLKRGAVARALGGLFLARARGEIGLFPVVVAVVESEAGAAAVLETLAGDPLVRGRFRLD